MVKVVCSLLYCPQKTICAHNQKGNYIFSKDNCHVSITNLCVKTLIITTHMNNDNSREKQYGNQTHSSGLSKL